MNGSEFLLEPQDCALLMVDFQAGLGFGVESAPKQSLVANAVALAKTAVAFQVPVIASTSASHVYSGPLLPALQAVLPSVKPTERKNMNVWEDDAVRAALLASGKKRFIVAGFLTEACVTFPVLSALKEGFEVFVVADCCGGLTAVGHEMALRRMEVAGAQLVSWIQVLLEFQRDWTRHETYDSARAIVEENGGGYGMGLAYARTMIHPS
jgi:nicotinamidase-related amidase